MAIPIILGGLAVASALSGAKKGYDAKKKNDKAKRIVSNIRYEFSKTEEELKESGENLNKQFEEFAKFKLYVFSVQINNLVKTIKRCKKKANSELLNEKIKITPDEIKKLELSVSSSLEITSGLAKGVASGTLTAMGAYGSVGMLATASTGTAISTLSGAAATNATLAWLGGGSLAAGGGGIALGTAVMSGMVAGPLVAVAGFVMDSKAETNLTEAYEYEKEMSEKIETMKLSMEKMNISSKRVDELTNIIQNLVNRFDKIYDNSYLGKFKRFLSFFGFLNFCDDSAKIDRLLEIGIALKQALDISLIDKKGNNNINYIREVERTKI